MSKLFVNSSELFKYSSILADKILNNYKPDAIIGLSRGGSTPSIIIHEYLNYKDVKCNYYNISCKSYNDDNTQKDHVFVDCTDYTITSLQDCNKILIVDDVFDSGLTIMNVLNYLSKHHILSYNIKIATIFYKPKNNKTTIIPNFVTKKTDDWVVFPHELMGLNEGDISYKINHENNH
tara:strand:+ start:271 stop:804 length:534 start_codon:yes stop_codon:yes gene_type:complete